MAIKRPVTPTLLRVKARVTDSVDSSNFRSERERQRSYQQHRRQHHQSSGRNFAALGSISPLPRGYLTDNETQGGCKNNVTVSVATFPLRSDHRGDRKVSRRGRGNSEPRSRATCSTLQVFGVAICHKNLGWHNRFRVGFRYMLYNLTTAYERDFYCPASAVGFTDCRSGDLYRPPYQWRPGSVGHLQSNRNPTQQYLSDSLVVSG